ncbi:MAG: hypothetical protein DMF61_02895 [Blastocatellia bacterium AA13]|nr:MAG: hypothetical protein DMF61_02895 [Blastocatellia bacterium AA13]
MKSPAQLLSGGERGIALATVLMLTLLMSVLVAAMLIGSTNDALISGNDVTTNQAFYIAEAGIHRASGWFSSKFGADPNGGLYILPQEYQSNTAGAAGQFSYTDPPLYTKGASATSPEQSQPSCVKILTGGILQNVVLAGDGTGTFPATYSITANDASGSPKVFNYSGLTTDFTNTLYNQTEGEGKFSIKATLVSITPPSGTQHGSVTWLLRSDGVIYRAGNTAMANATIWAYMSALTTPVQSTTVTTTTQTVGAGAGVIGRGMIHWNANGIVLDSYKSSKGAYGVALASNSYPGQIGSINKGRHGDMRTNNEFSGYIDVSNGTVTGGAYATLAAPVQPTDPNAIVVDTSKVQDGTGHAFSASSEYFAQAPLTFPTIPDPPTPPSGSPNYSWASKNSGTLPSGNYNNISISKGSLTVAPGNYGTIDVSSQGTVVLGAQGTTTTYNLQGFTSGAQATIVFKGPVIINVKSTLDVGAQSSPSDLSMPASAIRWNFVGGANQTISIGGGGKTLGVFYAPNNDLSMRGNTSFYGSIVARNVSVGGTADIHVDEDALSGVTTTVGSSTSTTVTVGYTGRNYNLWRITQTLN